MAINYTEKGAGLFRAISQAGHWLVERNRVWISSDDVAVQAIIDSFDFLPDYKDEKAEAIKAEALIRINALFPAITSVDQVALFAELWSSLRATAKQTTANLQRVIDIYTVARAGVIAVRAAANKAAVDAVVVTWPA